MDEIKDRGYSLTIDKEIEMTGVKKAIECTDKSIRLQLKNGNVAIYGSELDIKNMDIETGKLTFTGNVSEINFGSAKAKGFLSKLFK